MGCLGTNLRARAGLEAAVQAKGQIGNPGNSMTPRVRCSYSHAHRAVDLPVDLKVGLEQQMPQILALLAI
eukprot:CAMPEP_0114548430 /NCGR_PEP_ID=MMETSP0114-20121206/4975_1 /TAXON_ID=31324 /ORGANISM="Goniomonas sp, Strain m" /LENGTH=69 /DNA_ID=CAMNT_0001733015 /DNA_START=1097 /DNA_END=1306 /DNA_ORIENTATION=-